MELSTTQRTGRFRRRMASGLVALIPVVVTIGVLRFLFNFTASILLPFVDPAVATWPPGARAALSFGILLLGVYLLGELATNFVGRRILLIGESIVLRVPFVKVVYSASKQVVAAFQGREAKAFKSVVFVEFPRPGMRALGFVTGAIADTSGKTWTTVFVPTTPNPTTGFLQIVPPSDVVPTSYSVEEGVKMIMSLGVLAPDAVAVVPPGESR
jgi:uncharacterized membrane protein